MRIRDAGAVTLDLPVEDEDIYEPDIRTNLYTGKLEGKREDKKKNVRYE